MFDRGVDASLQTVRTKKNDIEKTLNKYVIHGGAKSETDELRKMSALIRFYFRVDPAKLTDDEFAIHWNDLKFALDFENERNKLK